MMNLSRYIENQQQQQHRHESDETTAEENSTADHDRQSTESSDPVCLEGVLHFRKGRISSLIWKRRFVHLDLVENSGGSITVFKTDVPVSTIKTRRRKKKSRAATNGSDGNDVDGEVVDDSDEDVDNFCSSALVSSSAAAASSPHVITTSALRSVYTKLHEFSSSMMSGESERSRQGIIAASPGEQSSDSPNLPKKKKQVQQHQHNNDYYDDIDIHIPAHMPWVVKDVQNDTSSFVVEIPTTTTHDEKGDENDALDTFHNSGTLFDTFHQSGTLFTEDNDFLVDVNEGDELEEEDAVTIAAQDSRDSSEHGGGGGGGYDSMSACINMTPPTSPSEDGDDLVGAEVQNNNKIASLDSTTMTPKSVTGGNKRKKRLEEMLSEELDYARSRGKPLRLYFRCSKGTNEKALWLQAFSRLGRLSSEVRRRHGILGTLAKPLHYGMKHTASRIRRGSMSHVARDVRQLELANEDIDIDGESIDVLNYTCTCNDVENLAAAAMKPKELKLANDSKEFRVQPTYAYPHRWMTKRELREEMILPTETFHDLRLPDSTKKEIGMLRVEVLQCLGLPKLDRTALTDAIVYLVCGSYAFATDVIPNMASPMWLRKARRACIFPLYHAYAKLYVGVFDDDHKKVKDEFAGRVVINLSRLRPKSTYDVTLPLRLSTSVYSRRRRGAIRLRFTVRWNTEREALMSYIPKNPRIPLPQHTKPNVDTTVLCADQKSFRNIAITVHGSHLPGKFTFQQMRAAIREINFTRKHVFTALRMWFKDTRNWVYPLMSAYIFLAWMHCIYANAFSLVPAYLVLYFFIHLMKNYARYSIDNPGNRGFVPPSWEEMFMALVRGTDPDYCAIEPLDLGLRPSSLARRRTPESLAYCGEDLAPFDYRVKTHNPQGKPIFKALGWMNDRSDDFLAAEEEHLEFPFANGVDYPKLTVRESLVPRKGETSNKEQQRETANTIDGNDSFSSIPVPAHEEHRGFSLRDNEMLRGMEFPDIMRKDSSGLRDFDEEEDNFATRRAVVASGKHMGKKTVSTLTKAATGATEMSISAISKTATGISEVSGLHHVVTPIAHGVAPIAKPIVNMGVQGINMGVQGISSGVSMGVQGISTGASLGVHGMSMGVSAVSSGVSGAVHHAMSPINKTSQSLRRSVLRDPSAGSYKQSSAIYRPQAETEPSGRVKRRVILAPPPIDTKLSELEPLCDDVIVPKPVEIDPLLVFPEQNVDVEGPSTGKKLTEDLDEIKEKMHEMTWNLFNDKLYVVKNPDALYFGQAKKHEKRRKTDVPKEIDKLMRVKQYSHSNPFVARVGLYVEPIIGSTYSFLCVFRAGFNVMTWRDPLLTFWISLISGVLAIILFVFPWRIFLFGLGIFLVGPQNLVIRILREKGHLPPVPPRKEKEKPEEENLESGLPKDQPVFTLSDRQPGKIRKGSTPADPREVHRVVVPYTPLIYHRFYDWPPEPQYAQVKPDNFDEARRRLRASTLFNATGGRRSAALFTSYAPGGGKQPATINRVPSLGERLLTSKGSDDGSTATGPRRRYNRIRTISVSGSSRQVSSSRRRFNTGDWQGGVPPKVKS